MRSIDIFRKSGQREPQREPRGREWSTGPMEDERDTADWGRRAQQLEGSADYGAEPYYGESRGRDAERGYGFIGGREHVVAPRPPEVWRGQNEEHDFWGFERHPHASLWDRVKGAFSGKGPKNYTRSDERIREDVCDHLSYHPYIDASDIEVVVRDGEVTLTGTVDGRMVKRAAEECCEHVRGVEDIHNHLRVKRVDQPSP